MLERENQEDREQSLAELKKEFSRKQAELKEHTQRLERYKLELARIAVEIETVNQNIKSLSERREEVDDKRASLTTDSFQQDQLIEVADNEVLNHQQAIDSKQAEFDAANAVLEELENRKSKLEDEAQELKKELNEAKKTAFAKRREDDETIKTEFNSKRDELSGDVSLKLDIAIANLKAILDLDGEESQDEVKSKAQAKSVELENSILENQDEPEIKERLSKELESLRAGISLLNKAEERNSYIHEEIKELTSILKAREVIEDLAQKLEEKERLAANLETNEISAQKEALEKIKSELKELKEELEEKQEFLNWQKKKKEERIEERKQLDQESNRLSAEIQNRENRCQGLKEAYSLMNSEIIKTELNIKETENQLLTIESDLKAKEAEENQRENQRVRESRKEDVEKRLERIRVAAYDRVLRIPGVRGNNLENPEIQKALEEFSHNVTELLYGRDSSREREFAERKLETEISDRKRSERENILLDIWREFQIAPETKERAKEKILDLTREITEDFKKHPLVYGLLGAGIPVFGPIPIVVKIGYTALKKIQTESRLEKQKHQDLVKEINEIAAKLNRAAMCSQKLREKNFKFSFNNDRSLRMESEENLDSVERTRDAKQKIVASVAAAFGKELKSLKEDENYKNEADPLGKYIEEDKRYEKIIEEGGQNIWQRLSSQGLSDWERKRELFIEHYIVHIKIAGVALKDYQPQNNDLFPIYEAAFNYFESPPQESQRLTRQGGSMLGGVI